MGSHNVHRGSGATEGPRYDAHANADDAAGDKRADEGRASHRRPGPPVVGRERPQRASAGGEKTLRLTRTLKRLLQKAPSDQAVTGLSAQEMDQLLSELGPAAPPRQTRDFQKLAVQRLAPRLDASQRKQIVAHATRDDFTFPIETTLHTVGPLLGAMTDEEMDVLHTKIFAPRVPDLAAAEHGFPDRRLATDAKAGVSIGVLLSSADMTSTPRSRVRQLAQWACEDGCNALSTIVATGPTGLGSGGIYRPPIDRFAAMLLPSEREAIFNRAVPRLAETPSAKQRMIEVSADLPPRARRRLQAQLDAMREGPTPPNPGWAGR